MRNADLDGKMIAPWAPALDQMCDIDPPHGWDAAHLSFNGGANNGFVQQHQIAHGNLRSAIEPMQFLSRKELPTTWALADAYASADRWFCSVMGPTFPNRYYWHTGESGGLMSNIFPPPGGFPWPSIYNRLRDRGVDWAYYHGSIPFVSLLANFDVTDHIGSFSDFLLDAADGKLPPVVYIDPIFNNNDDHPPVHPINGQQLIAAVYTALAQSPQWSKCMLVVTYDENGGFFDHVAPPKTVDDRASEGFDQLGFRVPTLVAGPYIKEGHVSSVVYDHTSALRHLEVTFGLESLNQRTMAANDLSDFIDMDRVMRNDPRPPITLPDVNVDAWPQDPVACQGGTLAVDHPIIAWADANPDRVKDIDLRPNIPEYRRQIAELLRSGLRAAVK
jgi:phospholipase C